MGCKIPLPTRPPERYRTTITGFTGKESEMTVGRRTILLGAVTAAALPALLAAGPGQATGGKLAPDLAEPVQIMAGDTPIDVTVGHAAPYLHDMNDDGKRDLLVGQFGDGALRIYTNAGTNEQPKFDEKFEWFTVEGGAKGTVPFG